MRYTEFQVSDGCLVGHNPLEANRTERYLIGIIDILVQYNARKKLENFFRGTIGGAKVLTSSISLIIHRQNEGLDCQELLPYFPLNSKFRFSRRKRIRSE
jgi:hypothetical protein